MRIILSRKGFDSAAGGCPNPILPGGRLVPLPIPDSLSPIKYQDIQFDEHNLGYLVNQLTKGRLRRSAGAHLDPDLVSAHYPRHTEWLPLLGQTGSAQGHLSRQGVSKGDIFIFFGVFQPVVKSQPKKGSRAKWQFDSQQSKRHIIWGWMQIGEILKIDELDNNALEWARYHPHFYRGPDSNNTLYLANASLQLPESGSPLPGSGTFRHLSNERILTAPDSLLTQWELPQWWHPGTNKPPLSYHHKIERWQQLDNQTRLKAAARGQEFVLDCDYYPEALPWVRNLIQNELTLGNNLPAD
ncbi:hypothetical protein [Hahella ganghwensis]|uniref:Nmad3 family putative nucleotide modification protein n=1 Tax=Hahella ganghwensis TaxID=286420 RepID=UPI000375470C|nr:hypothetical protein [Hahella ganghwensis]